MTKLRLALSVLAALPQIAAAQAGRIDNVLVYPGGATVERVIAVKAGAQWLKIACLPARFDADSLQVRAGEGATVQIGAISVQTADRATQPECASSPLDARIRELEDQRSAVVAEIGAHEVALGYLKNLGSGAPTTGVAATAEAVRRTGLESLQRLPALQRRKEEFDRQITPLTAERDRAMQANPQFRTVLVRLAAARDSELRLSYRLSQAGWEPVYRAHLDTASGKVRLERLAQVAQNSGEDWREVKLRLSTTQPRQATGVASPQPWTLDLLPPPGSEAQQRFAPVAASPAPMAMAVGAARPAPDLGFNVAVFQGEFATEFEVPGRVAVASDGQRIAMALGDTALDSRLIARANPRSEAAAYLVTESPRPDGIWPAGSLQVFRDGAFVGQTRLDIGSEDKLDLFFGRDAQVRVTTEPEQRNAANAGFIGSRAEQKIGHAYRVENLHQRPFTVQVLEASPVARHEDIKVQSQFDPKPAELSWRKRPGIVAWEFTLAPGGVQRLSADYLISTPKDARISGIR